MSEEEIIESIKEKNINLFEKSIKKNKLGEKVIQK
jgi:hypothetical protein